MNELTREQQLIIDLGCEITRLIMLAANGDEENVVLGEVTRLLGEFDAVSHRITQGDYDRVGWMQLPERIKDFKQLYLSYHNQ